MNLPQWILRGAVVAALIAFLASVRWARGRKASERTFRLAYHLMTILLGAAAAVLMHAILAHDFRYEYVAGYTSRDLPTLYLISAFWAGQAGTILLWALFAALLGYPIFRRRSWEAATVAAFYTPTVGFLLLLMLNAGGDPFRLVTRVPPDGRGLNPLLQDPWMASHPPVVFLGYAAMTIPAVLALAALLRGGGDGWLRRALPWALAGFLSLGTGIILGGIWAYKVLGWGGYWGWDPVENASLVPWIAVTALVHGILAQRGTGGAFRRTNFAVAIAGYLLILYGTFLTRSGVLADFSVHSFPQGTIYRFLVAALLLAGGGSLYLFLRHRGEAGRRFEWNLAWPPLYGLVLALLLVSALLVLAGTSWPLLSSIAGRPAAMRPGFYNRSNLPLYVLLLGLLAVGPFLAWQARTLRSIGMRLLPALLAASAGTAAAAALGARGTGSLILFFCALAALASNLVRLIQVARVAPLQTGAAIAHAGFALMFAGIIGSSAWGSSETLLLQVARPVPAFDRILTFQGHVRGSGPKDRWRIAVRKGEEPARFVDVGLFPLPAEGGKEEIFRRPGILRGLDADLYIAPQDLVQEPGRRFVELERNRPAVLGDTTVTFLRFETGAGAPGTGMIVRGVVRFQRGDAAEEADLPVTATAEGLRSDPVEVGLLPGISLSLERMAVEQGKILVQMLDPAAGTEPALTVEVSRKPLIGLLWSGTFLLLAGCSVAAVRRARDLRLPATLPLAAIPARGMERRSRAPETLPRRATAGSRRSP